jgi:hypothetical protein
MVRPLAIYVGFASTRLSFGHSTATEEKNS